MPDEKESRLRRYVRYLDSAVTGAGPMIGRAAGVRVGTAIGQATNNAMRPGMMRRGLSPVDVRVPVERHEGRVSSEEPRNAGPSVPHPRRVQVTEGSPMNESEVEALERANEGAKGLDERARRKRMQAAEAYAAGYGGRK